MENKEKQFLVCMDSDGCAIDSMTVKHERAFGPAFIRVVEVADDLKDEVLNEWEAINLYRLTRGINRFKGFVLILKKYPELCNQHELEVMEEWTRTTTALSAEALQAAYGVESLEIMRKALEWSDLVNKIIEELPLAEPFVNVHDAIKAIHEVADIAVISSANKDAIVEEWKMSGLYDLPKYFFAQSDGTKSQCIRKMIESGYHPSNIIMLGDSIGDLEAAMSNGVLFYPIFVREESASWHQFKVEYLQKFMNHEITPEIQNYLVDEMKMRLQA